MTKHFPAILAAALLLLNAPFSAAADPAGAAQVTGQASVYADPSSAVSIELIPDTTAIEPGKPFRIGARFTLQPGWHVYYKEPGDSGFPPNITLNLPDGYQVTAIEWEKPHKFEENGFTTYGYEGATTVAVTITPPSNIDSADAHFDAEIQWLACKDSCVPGSASLSLNLPVATDTSPAQAANGTTFASVGYTGDLSDLDEPATEQPKTSILDGDLKLADDANKNRSFASYLFLAFIGGVILTFMPCVLPVLSLKIMRFVQESGEDKSKIFRLNFAYAAGTVGTCLLLGLAVIIAQALGYSIGWGFQFQQPLFLIAMTTLITLMSLSLFGVFHVQMNAGSGLDKLSQKQGYAGAFFTGVVATILSTPCTAPFLGTAIGFAFSQPWWAILSIFGMIGLGLATPYLILSLNPGWLKLLPRPGAWMERFKEAMGFVLLGSAVWLLWVLGRQIGPDGAVGTLAFLVCASFAAWLINGFSAMGSSMRRKIVVWSLALARAGGGLWLFVLPSATSGTYDAKTATQSQSTGGIDWQPFSKEAVDQHLADGKVVFIDFTADWCQTCKFNEATVLDTSEVESKINELGAVALKADWTNYDPELTAVLAKFGRAGVPLYVVFSPHRPDAPEVLPTLLSKKLVIDTLEKASKP